MNCPACKTHSLAKQELESRLAAMFCTGCGGHWIDGAAYWIWLEQHGQNLPTREPGTQAASPPTDSIAGKLCPKCGRFLTRNKVGQGVGFHLDRCAACGGIWLDKNEWDSLKSRNLHDDLHYVFSEAWQSQLRQKERADADRRRLVENLGEETVQRLEVTRQWIDSHPKRRVLQAYLLGQND